MTGSTLETPPAGGLEGGQIEGHPSLATSDLLPTPVSSRRWTWWHYAALWMGMVHNIFNFTWMGGLIILGFSIWQALVIAAVGTLIQTIAIGFSGRIGARFGIPFPVWARTTFGTRGANIPAILRGLTAIGWFGIQSYLAALAVNVLLGNAFSSWHDLSQYTFLYAGANMWIAMVIYWAANFLVLRHGMETVRRFESWAGPAIFVVVAVMLVWVVIHANGVGPMFNQPAKVSWGDFFLTKFIPGLSVFIAGSWATMTLNIPDLTRFARSNKGQFWGTMIGLPLASLVYYGMVAVIVSAGVTVFGKALWDPSDYLAAIDVPAISIIGALLLALATMSVNVPSNIVSPAYDFCNLIPQWFTFKRGAVVAIVISFVYGPWIIMRNPDSFYTLLNNIGAILGPILGIMLADFYIIRRRRISVPDLYLTHGKYRATGGVNVVSTVIFVVLAVLLLLGQVVGPIEFLYTNAWFIGIILGFGIQVTAVAILRARGARYAENFAPLGSEGQEAAEDEVALSAGA